MKKLTASCELITIEGGGHGMGSWRTPQIQHRKSDMVAWLTRTLNVK